jgi:hypothetical protein
VSRSTQHSGSVHGVGLGWGGVGFLGGSVTVDGCAAREGLGSFASSSD